MSNTRFRKTLNEGFTRKSIALAAALISFTALTGMVGCSSNSGSTPSTQTSAAVTNSSSALALTPANQTINTSATLQLQASGGTAPYVYAITQGEGTVDANGLFTAPAAAETDIVTVTDAAGSSAVSTIVVMAPAAATPLALAPSSPSLAPSGTVTFIASGGTAPYTYSVSSGTGTINSSTGIFVAPAAAETDTVLVTDSTGATASATVTVSAAAPVTALSISPVSSSLSAGATQTLVASGGTAPYTFAVTSGTGTIVSTSGLFTAPLVAETDIITVTDAAGNKATSTLTITAAATPLQISPAKTNTTEGSLITFAASGGTPPYSYSITAGTGTINNVTGAYVAPMTAETDSVLVTDATGATASASIIVAAPSATTLQISPATTNLTANSSITYSATGGTPPYIFSVSAGKGLINASTGVFTAPDASETDTILVTDSAGVTSSATAVITASAAAPLMILPLTPKLAINSTLTFTATGGTAPYSYTVLVGSGSIVSTSGLFTAPGLKETDVVEVVDSAGHSASTSLRIVAAQATAPTAPTSTMYPMVNSTSNDTLWASAFAIDGNVGTSYSSIASRSEWNHKGFFLAAWMAGPQSVTKLNLTARLATATRVPDGTPLGFPKVYSVYLTASDNSSWIKIGDFSNQPDSTGVASITLPGTYTTYGVMIVPSQLGTDDYGNYYFQMAEIQLGN